MQTKKGLRGAKGPLITIAIITIVFVVILFNFFYRPSHYGADIISKDLALLQNIFKKIDDTCRILGFENQKDPINFLNVGTFKSSELGSMDLAYPKEWQGPYVQENPHYQNIEYQVVKTKKGYFITPGDGVELPNGKKIGKDIVLNENADIEAMMHDEHALMYKGKTLAAPLILQTSTWKKILFEQLPDEGMVQLEHQKPAVHLACK